LAVAWHPDIGVVAIVQLVVILRVLVTLPSSAPEDDQVSDA